MPTTENLQPVLDTLQETDTQKIIEILKNIEKILLHIEF